jgi:hypothetical protein
VYSISTLLDFFNDRRLGDISDLLNGLAAEHQADLLAAMGDS